MPRVRSANASMHCPHITRAFGECNGASHACGTKHAGRIDAFQHRSHAVDECIRAFRDITRAVDERNDALPAYHACIR